MNEHPPTLEYEAPRRRRPSSDLFAGTIVSWTILTLAGGAVVLLACAVAPAGGGALACVLFCAAAGVIAAIHRSTADADYRADVIRGTMIGIGVGLAVNGSIWIAVARVF